MVVLVLSCTENFEAAAEEKTLDYEYEFYETYLKKYVCQESETGYIKVDEISQRCFEALKNAYSSLKSNLWSENGIEDKFADSLMFYIATGLIFVEGGNYYINVKKLMEITANFKKAKEDSGCTKIKSVHK